MAKFIKVHRHNAGKTNGMTVFVNIDAIQMIYHDIHHHENTLEFVEGSLWIAETPDCIIDMIKEVEK